MRIPEDEIRSVPMSNDGFPSSDVDQKMRSSPAYIAAWMMSAYNGGSGFWGGVGWEKTFRQDFALMRMYACASQPESPYTRRYSLPQGDTSRSGNGGLLLSSDPSILPVLPQFLTKVQKIATQYPTTPSIVAGDPASKSEAQDFYYEKLVDMYKRKQIEDMYAALGVIKDPSEAFESEEEVNLFISSGGYKAAVAVALENLAAASLEQTRYDELVRDEVVRLDLIPNGMGAVACWMDASGVLRSERVAPENLLFPWTDKVDASAGNWIGRFRAMTDDEIAMEAGDQVGKDELKEIRDMWTRTAGSLGWTLGGFQRGGSGNLSGETMVLDFYRIGKRELNYKKDKKGTYRKIGDEKLIPDSEAKEPRRAYSSLAVYGGSWVIGSNIFWNLGLMKSQPMIAPGRPRLPITVIIPKNYGESYTSVVRMCKVSLDQIQLSNLRMQSIADKNGPAILAYMKQALSYTAAGDKIKLEELFRSMHATGTIGFEMPPDFFGTLGGNGSPLFKLDINDQRNAIETELMIFHHHLETLMRNLGFADVNSGGPVSDRKGKAVAEMENKATVMALSDLIDGVVRLGTEVTRSMLGFAVTGCCDSSQQEYWRQVAGDQVVDSVKILARDAAGGSRNALVLEGIGVGILPYPDPDDVRAINNQVEIALMGRDGQVPMLSLGEAFQVRRLIASGRVESAKALLLSIEKKKKKEAQKAKQAEMEALAAQQQQLAVAQGQQQQQLFAMKAEADAGKIQATAESKMMQDAQKAQADAQLQQAGFQNQAQITQLQGSINGIMQKMQAMLDAQQSDRDAAHEREAIRLQAEEDRRTQVVVAENRPEPKKS